MLRPKDFLSDIPEAELMRLVANGNIEAAEVLYRRYREPLRRFLIYLSGSAELAKDLAQDTWIKLFDASTQRGFDTARPIKPFLFTIARNVWIDWWRKNKNTQTHAEVPEPPPFDPQDLVEKYEVGQALRECIENLPNPQREAFLLQAEGGLSVKEIADATNAVWETVKTRLRYARESLRKCLERKGFGPPYLEPVSA